MGLRWSGVAAVALLAALEGCGKDNEVGPKPAEIYGSWRATQVLYVSKTDPNVRVNLCDSAGCWARLEIQSDHNIQYMLKRPRVYPDTTTGTWQLDGDLFKMYPTGAGWYWTWDIQLSGNTLKLTGADMRWDFDSDGLFEDSEEADQDMVLTR